MEMVKLLKIFQTDKDVHTQFESQTAIQFSDKAKSSFSNKKV